VRDLAFAELDEVNGFVKGGTFCLPCGFTSGRKNSQHGDAFSLAPVLTALLLGWKVQFIPLFLFLCADAKVNDSWHEREILLQRHACV
jgi:hypothetical protein